MTGKLPSGIAILVAGTALAAGVVRGGQAVAERVIAAGSIASPPVVETVFTALVLLPLAVIAFVAAKLDGAVPGPADRRWWRPAAIGIAIGLFGLVATLADARVAGMVAPGEHVPTHPSLILWGAVVVLVQAASEEIFFRGWLQRALTRRWGALPAVIGAAAAFAIAHLAGGERAPLSLLNLLLGGLVFGALAARPGGLAAAIGAHWAWNAAEQLGFGLDPNPGLGSFGALWSYDLVGPASWGGSAEGLNAGLPMTMVLLAIVAGLAVARFPHRRSGRAHIA